MLQTKRKTVGYRKVTDCSRICFNAQKPTETIVSGLFSFRETD